MYNVKTYKVGCPVRPIVSAIKTFNCNLCTFVVLILAPFTCNQFTISIYNINLQYNHFTIQSIYNTINLHYNQYNIINLQYQFTTLHSAHFLAALVSAPTVSPTAMASFDVPSLYTSVPTP